MILNIIFILLFFIIFLILFVLSISCKYKISFNYDNSYNKKILISNFFFTWEVLNSDKKKNKKKVDKYNYKKEKSKINENKEKSSSKIPFKLINKENINYIFKFLFNLYKEVKIEKINFDLLINLEDPYYNGILLSSYYSIKEFYPKLPIKINISWEKEVNKAQGIIEGSFRPISIIYTIVIFIFSPHSLKLLWKYYKFRKKA